MVIALNITPVTFDKQPTTTLKSPEDPQVFPMTTLLPPVLVAVGPTQTLLLLARDEAAELPIITLELVVRIAAMPFISWPLASSTPVIATVPVRSSRSALATPASFTTFPVVDANPAILPSVEVP